MLMSRFLNGVVDCSDADDILRYRLGISNGHFELYQLGPKDVVKRNSLRGFGLW